MCTTAAFKKPCEEIGLVSSEIVLHGFDADRIMGIMLAQEENDPLRQGFCRLDADGNGALTRTELRDGLSKLGVDMTSQELGDLFLEENEMGWSEFDRIVRGNNGDASSRVFDALDENGDGFLSWSELSRGLSKIAGVELTETDVLRLREAAKKNPDENITFPDFDHLVAGP